MMRHNHLLRMFVAVAVAACLGASARNAFAGRKKGADGAVCVNCFNGAAYGMKSDNSTDNSPMLQKMLDAACAAGGGQVVIPARNPKNSTGGYGFWEPVNIGCDNIDFSAPGAFLDYHGIGSAFLVVLGAATSGPDLAPSLLSGPGNAIKIDQSSAPKFFLNLSDTRVSVDGLSQLSVSAEVEFKAGTFSKNNSNYIFGSTGSVLGTTTSAFLFTLNYFGSQPILQFGLTTRDASGATTVHTLFGTTPITAGVAHNVEADYDGFHIYLFLDGHLEASTTASGVVSQQPSEDMIVGEPMVYWPESGGVLNGGPSELDAIQISKVARHTASFANPTSKPSVDGNILLLTNFDSFNRFWVRSDVPPAWMITRRADEPDGTPEYANQNNLGLIRVHDIVMANGIYFSFGQHCTFQNLTLYGGPFVAWSNAFEDRYDNIWIDIYGPASQGNPPYGFLITSQADFSSLTNIQISGNPDYGFMTTGLGGTASNLEVTEGLTTRLGGVISSSAPLTIYGIGVDAEVPNPLMQAAYAFSGNWCSVTVNGGEFLTQNGAPPLIVNNNWAALTFVGPSLFPNGGTPPEMVELIGNNTSAPVLVNPQSNPSSVPISNGDVIVVPSLP
jgi:hypothetical protein